MLRNSSFTKLGALLILGCGFLTSNAAEVGVDLLTNLGEVTPGEVCSLTASGQYYTYTPSETGQISVQTNYMGAISNLLYTDGNQSYLMFYPYWDLYMQQSTASYEMITGEGWELMFNVTEGTEYIFGYTDLLGTGPLNFTVTEGSQKVVDATLTYCYPAPGTTFDEIQRINDFTLEFDQSVLSVDRVYIEYTDKSGNVKTIDVPESTVESYDGYEIVKKILIVRVSNTNNVYAQAKADADYAYPFYLKFDKLMCGSGPVTSANLSEGTEFVTVDGEGNVAIEYEFMDAVQLVSQSWPEKFYSYWAPGEPAGMATLTFNGPIIAKNATMSIIMGHIYRGSAPSSEDPEISFPINYTLSDDNTVMTINFTGVNYGADLEGKEFLEVTIQISGFKGENGMNVDLGDGLSYMDTYIPFVNETYGGVKVPMTMSANPTLTPANYTTITSLENVVAAWEEPVSLVEGITPLASVKFGTFDDASIPVTVEEGVMVIGLSKASVPVMPFLGDVVITVPSGLVENTDGDINKELTIVYTGSFRDSSGVETLLNDKEGSNSIYNFQGVRVNNVGKGLYIINGKKVLVK